MNDHYYNIAVRMAAFTEDFDTYGFRDAYDNFDDAVEDAAGLLAEGKETALENFRAIYADSWEDLDEISQAAALSIEEDIKKYVE